MRTIDVINELRKYEPESEVVVFVDGLEKYHTIFEVEPPGTDKANYDWPHGPVISIGDTVEP